MDQLKQKQLYAIDYEKLRKRNVVGRRNYNFLLMCDDQCLLMLLSR